MADRDRQPGGTRAGDVLQRMRLDIITCALKPGERLRFELLRARYDVSFSTLREALSRLAAESLVVATGQRGFAVAPVSVRDLNDLTDARVLIEVEMLRRSIRCGGHEWEAGILAALHRLDRMLERMGRDYYASQEWSAAHGAFHAALVSACRSPALTAIRHGLFERAHRYRHMSAQLRRQWRAKDVEHRMIVEATLERDPDRAARLIERHLRETSENVIAHAGHLFEAAPGPALLRRPGGAGGGPIALAAGPD